MSAPSLSTYQVITFVFCGLVIVSSVFAVLAFLFVLKQHSRPQYRVVVVLLFFALACVTSMLFVATNATFSGNFLGFSITVVGPAAIWLGGLFLFFYFVPEDSLYRNAGEDPNTLTAITKCVVEVEARQGWRMYSKWKNELRGGFSELFDRDETATVKSLLHTTYFTHELEKLSDPHIATLWLYFADAIIKVQRIRGHKEGEAAWIRFGSNPTADSATATSVFLVGEPAADSTIAIAHGFTERDTVQYRGLQQVAFEPVDCLIMTLYDDPGYEDYLLVDIKRFSQRNAGAVDIGVASFAKNIRSHSVWTLKQPVFTPEGEVPLALRKSLATAREGTRTVGSLLQPWLVAVDQLLDRQTRAVKQEVGDALIRLRATYRSGARGGNDIGFNRLPELADVAPSSMNWSIPNAQDVTMVLLRLWDGN